MNDYKKIVEQYEALPNCDWNKDANWQSISEKINTPKIQKNNKNWLWIFSAMGLLMIGFFAGKTHERVYEDNIKDQQPIQIQKLPIVKDTVMIAQIKRDTFYKQIIVFKPLTNETTPAETQITATVAQEIKGMIDEKIVDSSIVETQKPLLEMKPSIPFEPFSKSSISESKKRTDKKYAENVFFENIIHKPKHEFRFINRIPNYNGKSQKYAHGQ
jgi:hypothetical protein